MVFGWGKKKQEEKPVVEVASKKEISLTDIPGIVSDLESVRSSQAISEIKHLRNSTQPLIDELRNIGSSLEKDNLSVDDIDKHLAIIVIRGKKQVIATIKKDVVTLPEVSNIDDIYKVDTSLNQILKKVGDVLGRQTRIIHIFAKKYAAKLKENLETMKSNHSEIQNIIEQFDSTKTSASKIEGLLNNFKNKKQTRKQTIQRIESLQENTALLDTEAISLKNSIDKIKSSDDYQKYIQLRNSIDSFSNNKSKIKNEIDAQFTKISRPLGRYEYASSLDKEQKNILSKLVSEPIDVLIPQNKDSIIVILENVRKAINSGSISVKDVEKSLSHITETENLLDQFFNRILEFTRQYDKMKQDLDSLMPEKLLSLETQLTKKSSEQQDQKLKVSSLESEIAEIDSSMPVMISDIERHLRIFSNTKYSVSS